MSSSDESERTIALHLARIQRITLLLGLAFQLPVAMLALAKAGGE